MRIIRWAAPLSTGSSGRPGTNPCGSRSDRSIRVGLRERVEGPTRPDHRSKSLIFHRHFAWDRTRAPLETGTAGRERRVAAGLPGRSRGLDELRLPTGPWPDPDAVSGRGNAAVGRGSMARGAWRAPLREPSARRACRASDPANRIQEAPSTLGPDRSARESRRYGPMFRRAVADPRPCHHQHRSPYCRGAKADKGAGAAWFA